ncbi:MAG TPA: TonB-dependent receptor [Longimicrobiales bacterium]
MTRLFGVGCVLLMVAVPPGPINGQAVGRADVRGSIVDASTGEPLQDAIVMLERIGVADSASASTRASITARTTRSDSTGSYVFADVARGRYTLRASRIGYHAQQLIVTVQGPDDPRVSLGLSIEPVALEPLNVTGTADVRGDRTFVHDPAGEDADAARIAAVRARQRLFLPGDVRAVTRSDLRESVTLGESDLFRALQRLPGVSTIDEYSAELWMRGAAFDQMRIYVDGIPLFNPLHAAGAFGSVSPDAIGAAYLHAGTQPVSVEGGAAGTLELRTRAGEDDGEYAAGEISLVSARLAVDDASSTGERAYMVAARRTYLDLLTRLAERLGMDDVAVPYEFLDIAGRYDERVGQQSVIEASALVQVDALTGDVPDVLHGTRARWGSGLARVSLLTPVHGRRTRHTVGVSTFASRVRNVPVEQTGLDAPIASPSSNTLVHLTVRGELEREERTAWTGGYEMSRVHVDYRGPAPRSTLRTVPVQDTTELHGSNVRAALWLERRWDVGTLEVSGGARLETGSRARSTPRVRVAPRVAVRWQPSARTSVSTAFAHGFHYEQAIAPAGVSPDLDNFASEVLWVVAGDEVPALRSSTVTATAEHWLSTRWLVGATAWLRWSRGVAHQDPTPGLDVGRRSFVVGDARARGIDVSVRRLAGRWTGSFGYSLAAADASAAGFDFPADEDQRHVVDLTSALALGRGWVWSAAYTYAAGAPYTRFHEGNYECDATGACTWLTPPSRESRNARRRDATSSLDFALDWSRRFSGWTLGGFVQLRNVLGAENQGRYAHFEPPWCGGDCANGAPVEIEGFDKFHPGLPRLPLIGLRFAF